MYTVALIGCGRISFKHIEGFVKNSDVMKLIAVCDPLTERAEEKATEYKKNIPDSEVKIYSDYKQMLSELSPDIVTIATESGIHPEIAITALEAGSHVICEKPMALSTRDADAMNEAAHKIGRKLAVCFQNRFNAPVQKLRTALEAGRFGKLFHGMIQVRWNRNDAYYAEAPWRGTWEMDGGTLMNQCTHGIDLLQWMMGEDAVRVQAQTRRFIRPIEAEDFGAAIVEFRNGSVGIIEGSADIYPKNLNETLSVFGEKGSVVIGGIAVNKLETWRFSDADTIGDNEEKVLNPNEKDPPTVYGFGHAALFRDFVDAITENREPLVPGEKGKKALEIILAIYRSQKTGMPVDLPCDFSTLEMMEYFEK
ncbi:Gfo/Idh/MocA family protein [Breznakiella homolactica]|uniref:Gfo/Idh/MocA family protein n=1 Tax=Breznakiella homolactica TaxID=2798577 RepID=UPI001CBA5E63|nr:Gfo/Idh/MocA family oxidoreductase [Breznakiella homolactica]